MAVELVQPELTLASKAVSVSQLRSELNRYRKFLVGFSEAMYSEFDPSLSTVADWKESSEWLLNALKRLKFLVYQSRTSHKWIAYFQSLESAILKGAFCLKSDQRLLSGEPNLSPQDAVAILWESNRSLRRAISIIDLWLEDLGNPDRLGLESTLEIADLKPTLSEVCRTWNDHMDNLRKSIGSELTDREITDRNWIDEAKEGKDRTYRQCMTSRKAYLASLYFMTIYPEFWTSQNYDYLIATQSRLTHNMNEGSPYKVSVARRLDAIRQHLSVAT